MATFKIVWQFQERGTHDGRQIFSRVGGETLVEGITSKAEARLAFGKNHRTAPTKSLKTWYKILTVTKIV